MQLSKDISGKESTSYPGPQPPILGASEINLLNELSMCVDSKSPSIGETPVCLTEIAWLFPNKPLVP